MDIFVEYLVKKKKTASDLLKALGISFGGTLVLIIIFMLLMSYIPQLASLSLLLVAGGIYGIYMLITSFNLEYEYSMVNSEIDVDKIVNVRRRKRLTTVNIRSIDYFGQKKGSREFDSCMRNQNIEKIYACIDKNDDSVYYAVYRENDKEKMILFNPNEKMISKMQKINPHKIKADTVPAAAEV